MLCQMISFMMERQRPSNSPISQTIENIACPSTQSVLFPIKTCLGCTVPGGIWNWIAVQGYSPFCASQRSCKSKDNILDEVRLFGSAEGKPILTELKPSLRQLDLRIRNAVKSRGGNAWIWDVYRRFQCSVVGIYCHKILVF
jgi:hypothetical protein